MCDCERVNEEGALKLFFKKRPSFRKVYDDAPDGAKAYYRGTCLLSIKALSDNKETSDDGDREWENLLLSLTDSDWEYLKSHAPTAIVGCGLQVTQNRIKREKGKSDKSKSVK